jgi:O-antigen ligase
MPRPLSRNLYSPGFLLLLFFVATAPVPFGGVLPGGTLKLEVLAFLTAAFTFLEPSAFVGSEPRFPTLVRASLAATLGLSLLAGFQTLPLPGDIVHALSPVASEAYRSAGRTLALLAGPSAPLPRLSLHPTETVTVGLLTLAYAAIFVSAFRLLNTRLRRRVFFGVFLASTLTYIAMAVLADSGQQRLHGPYVNPDHFAGFLQIGLAVAFAFSWTVLSYAVARGWGQGREDVSKGDRLERRLVASAAAIVVWGLIATAIGLSHSRGGMLAAAGSTVFLVTMSAIFGLRRTSAGRHQRQGQRVASGAAGIFLGLLFVAAAAGSRPLLRFLATDPRDLGSDTRVRIWDLSLQAWKKFPIFGSGLGTYREAVRGFQPRDLVGQLENAHSDPLQLLVTGGALGAALGAVALGCLLFFLVRTWHRQPHREERAFALAGLGALVSLTLHGLVEFNFSLPATPAVLAAVLGASVAAAISSPERDELPSVQPSVLLSVRSTRAMTMRPPTSAPTTNVDRP